MIKISRLADYAVVVLTTLAKTDDAPLSAAELARAARLPEPTVAKVLKLLAQDNLVLSTRGAGGGYALAREPNDISLAEIIMAVDGPIALTSCVEGGDESCEFSAACPSKDRWGTVSGLLRSVLEKIALGDMIERKGVFDPIRKTKETDHRDYFN